MWKNYVWNPATCNCENRQYLASIMEDSAITCDDIIETYDDETNFNEKRATFKTQKQNFYILLAFLIITITLLIDVTIYSYLIKYWAKQRKSLPFHFKNSRLKELM